MRHPSRKSISNLLLCFLSKLQDDLLRYNSLLKGRERLDIEISAGASSAPIARALACFWLSGIINLGSHSSVALTVAEVLILLCTCLSSSLCTCLSRSFLLFRHYWYVVCSTRSWHTCPACLWARPHPACLASPILCAHPPCFLGLASPGRCFYI